MEVDNMMANSAQRQRKLEDSASTSKVTYRMDVDGKAEGKAGEPRQLSQQPCTPFGHATSARWHERCEWWNETRARVTRAIALVCGGGTSGGPVQAPAA